MMTTFRSLFKCLFFAGASVFLWGGSLTSANLCEWDPDAGYYFGGPSLLTSGGVIQDFVINAFAEQSDGKVIVAGKFTLSQGTNSRTNIMRVMPDNGQLDFYDFPVGANSITVDGDVYTIGLLSDDSFVIGGSFSSVNGQPRNNIAHFNSDGILRTRGIASVNGPVYAIHSFGSSYMIGGGFTQVNGVNHQYIAQINSIGGIDNSFIGGKDPILWPNAIQPLGPIRTIAATSSEEVPFVIGGELAAGGGQGYIQGMYWGGWYNSDFMTGSTSSPFVHSSGRVNVIKPVGDGTLYVGGGFKQINGQPRHGVAMLTSTGVLINTIDPLLGVYRASAGGPIVTGYAEVYDLTFRGGNLVVGGTFWHQAYQQTIGGPIIYQNSGNVATKNFTILDLNTLEIADYKDIYISVANNYEANLTHNGGVRALLPVDNKLLVGGKFNRIGSSTINRNLGVRLGNCDGICGNAHEFIFPLNATAYSPYFQCANGTPSTTQFPAQGGTVTWTCQGLPGGQNSDVCTASRESPEPADGVCGNANGQDYPANRTSYSPDVQCASGFPSTTQFPGQGQTVTWICQGVGGGADSVSCSASRQTPEPIDGVCGGADGHVFPENRHGGGGIGGGMFAGGGGGIGGGYIPPYTQCASGIPSNYQFPAPGQTVTWICNGLYGGNASTTCSASKELGQTVCEDDQVDMSFGNINMSGVSDIVNSILVQSDGKVVIGGEFTSVSGQPRFRLARLHADASIDMSFQNPNFSGTVLSIAGEIGGSMIVGGRFPGGVARVLSNGSIDPSFSTITNGHVHKVVIQPDGKILIAGNFTSVGLFARQRVARLNADGSVDETFQNPEINGNVSTIALQADGKILVGGLFSQVNGESRLYLARLNVNGSIDMSFTDQGVYDPAAVIIQAITIQTDGRILVGGRFTQIDGQPRESVARLLVNGGIDMTFNNPQVGSVVHSIAVDLNGKIIVGGDFIAPVLDKSMYLVRLHNNGGFDTNFNSIADLYDGDRVIKDIQVTPLGKFYVGGSFFFIGNVQRTKIARLGCDGGGICSDDAQRDPTFTIPGGRIGGWGIARQPDGKVVVSAYIGDEYKIIRVYEDGTLDTSFQEITGVSAHSITIQPDGKILLQETLGVGGIAFLGSFSRRNSDGTKDTSFISPTITYNSPSMGVGTGWISKSIVQSDGKILIAGLFDTIGGQSRTHLARLNSNGTLDMSFETPSINDGVYDLALQADGKILIGGAFTQIGLQSRFYAARLNANGTLDESFSNPMINNTVRSLLLLPDNTLFVGGEFTAVSSQQRTYIAKLLANGSVDTSFGNANISGGGGSMLMTSVVYDIERQTDGKIFVVGKFDTVQGEQRRMLARLLVDGKLDPTFSDPFPSGISSPGQSISDPIGAGTVGSALVNVILQPDGKVIVLGKFLAVFNNFQVFGLARFGCGQPICGDGNVDPGEQCDDGNNDPYDSCVTFDELGEAICQLPTCGDGFVQPVLGEECDDGINDGSKGCLKCKLLVVACGPAGGVPTPISPDTKDLCVHASPTNENTSLGQFTWTCRSDFGGANVSCTAPRQYTVTFDGNGGTGHTPTSKLVIYNTAVGTLPTNPTRNGFQFDGWNTQANGNGQTVTTGTVISSNVTFYAKWIIAPEDGVCGTADGIPTQTSPNSNLCATGSPINGQTTTGSYNWQCSGANGGADVSCSAPRQYVVTFDGNGGGGHTPTTKIVTYNTELGTLPTNPTRSGYSFVGWNTDEEGLGQWVNEQTIVLGTTTYRAQWTADGVDGFCGAADGVPTLQEPTNSLCLVGTSSNMTPGVPTFTWTCLGQNGGANASCSAPRQYLVTFDGNEGGGHAPTSKIVTHGAQVGTLPTNPTRSGYSFVAWNTQQNGGGQNVMPTTVVGGTTTYRAQWSLAPVNGVCGDANGQTFSYDASGYTPYVQCTAGEPSTTIFPDQGGVLTWTCSGQNGGTPSPTCSASRQSAPTDGMCGPVHQTTIYDNARTGNGLTPATMGLCAGGDLEGFSYNNAGSFWSRGCAGTDGGISVDCNAFEGRCGDGFENGPEQCDNGGLNGGPGATCSDMCTFVDCDPETIYPPGNLPGWYCPLGWVIQGCPGSYRCVRFPVEQVTCSECGNGTLDPGEACDYSDPTDPNREFCNIYCELNACGDGFTNTWAPDTTATRSWDPTGSTTSRSAFVLKNAITQNQGGFNRSLSLAHFGLSLDIHNQAIGQPRLLVAAPNATVQSVQGHGQIYGLNLDTSGMVQNIDIHFVDAALPLNSTILQASHFPHNLNLEETLGVPSVTPFDEILINIHSSVRVPILHNALSQQNLGFAVLPYPYTSSEGVIFFAKAVGDLSNSGIDDIVAVVGSGVNNSIKLVGHFATTYDLQLAGTQDFTIRKTYDSSYSPDYIRILPIGDSDGDGIPDVLLSVFNHTTNQYVLSRLLLNADGTVKNESTIYTSTMNQVNQSKVVPVYGTDIDGDGIADLVIFYEKNNGETDALIVLLQSNRTIKQTYITNLNVPLIGNTDILWLADAIFFPVAGNTPHIAVGSPKSFAGNGAVFIFEVVPPYGIPGEPHVENCDEGSYCNDLITRCDGDPGICPGGPAECQPRFINGCDPEWCIASLCGNGLLDPAGDDGILGTDDDEECDEGLGNNDFGSCTTMCKRPVCGDGIITDFAQRDDGSGNIVTYVEMCDPAHPSTPDCPDTCILTGGVNARCNYTFGSAEAYGASSFVELVASGTLCYPAGVIVPQEGVHDYDGDGNVIRWNRTCEGLLGGATSTCSLNTWTCGDGIVDVRAGEECDDGNLVNGDGCSDQCMRENLFVPADEENQCTPNSYPQIEEGELLPVWLGGTWSPHVSDLSGVCANASANTVVRNTIECYFDISRGDGTVATGSVACGTLPAQGQALIQNAATKFAPGISLAGANIFPGPTVQNWITHNNTPVYGQYLFTVLGMQMDYCALRRTSPAGTVTGSVTTLSNYENCENNADDNGDGFVDCADTNRCAPAIAPHCEDGFHALGAEICNNGIDDNGSGFTDCADWTCKSDPACLPAQAPYGGDNIVCFDGSGNPINQNNPACFQFFGTGHVPEPTLGQRTLETVSFEPDEPICDAGFSVSKGYFVQRGFNFSEQPNTGLDVQQFTNIEGISLVAEGTALDDSLNEVARYQGAGKAYLFDEFIDRYQIRAVQQIPISVRGVTYNFVKVPAEHIYFYVGTPILPMRTDLPFDEDMKRALLNAGGGTADTAFTLVLPESNQRLIIQGSVGGNAMYIAAGNIKFEPTALSCDTTDVVEGLFVAGGLFETDKISNSDISSATWCRGGNLQIRGTLLGVDIGDRFAAQRRSVLNAWNTSAFLFNDSTTFQAKDLFETCYLPNLLWNEIAKIYPPAGNGVQRHPVLGCMITENGLNPGASMNRKQSLLYTYLLPSVFPLSIQEKDTLRSNLLISLFPSGSMEGDGYEIACTVAPAECRFSKDGKIIIIQQMSFDFVQGMSASGKRLPDWLLDDGFTSGEDEENLYQLYAKLLDPIKAMFMNFATPVGPGQSWQINTSTIFGALNSPDLWGPELGTTSQFLAYLLGQGGQQSQCVLSSGKWKSLVTNIEYTEENACKIAHYSDFAWLLDNAAPARVENVARQAEVIAGSAVTISSQPKLWSDLPPGARQFLDSLIVAPR